MEMGVLRGADYMSGVALICVSEEAPHCFLGEWREGSSQVFGEHPDVSYSEGKASAE